MEEERRQKELFEFEEPKKSVQKLFSLFPRKDSAPIIFSPERVIFISIGIVMLYVIVYAIGVERGKSLAREYGNVTIQPTQPDKPLITQKTQVLQEKAVLPTAPAAQKAVSYYTIIVATFAKKETAQNEANILKRGGYDAFVYQSDSYFQTSVGRYANRDGADIKAALNKIKKTYRDAYVKLR